MEETVEPLAGIDFKHGHNVSVQRLGYVLDYQRIAGNIYLFCTAPAPFWFPLCLVSNGTQNSFLGGIEVGLVTQL